MLSTPIGRRFARIQSARRRANWTVVLAMAGCLAAFFPACASGGGEGISVELFPEEPPPANEYIIGVGDMLNVQVSVTPAMPEQDKLSGMVRVRSDGKITLSLVNDLQAAGKTPLALASDIEASLKGFLKLPQVTVIVVESSPLSISVFGEVGKAGVQMLTRNAGVAEALAAAGGLSPFAHKDRIYVIRPGEPKRIQFSYENLLRATGRGPKFRLRLGDVIVVE